MRITTAVKVKAILKDARTGATIRETPWKKNLVLDQGLNGLARKAPLSGYPAQATQYCKVGSGTNPTKIASGAITFTQTGTTLTASGGFFTAAMVGALFKWGTGTGGTEVYITAFGSDTVVTVATSNEVAAPEAGAVWMVQDTTLQTQLYSSNTYQTTTGDCETTYGVGTVTHKRTYTFSQQASQYTVNEIGWSSVSSSAIGGRIVLDSSVVVGTSNYLVVVISLTLTWSPATPTAVPDVGTNINTAGTAMLEWFGFDGTVLSTGAPSTDTSRSTEFGLMQLIYADYTQGVATLDAQTSAPTVTSLNNANSQAWLNDSNTVGKMEITFSQSINTNGQTLYGIGMRAGSGANKPIMDVKLTTPVVLPVGTWQGATVFALQFGRELEN